MTALAGPDVDVAVVGGGPVGLAAAVLAARRGLSAAVVERRADPVDKACGEGLMPSAVRALAALGVDPPGVAFAGIRYVDAAGARSVTARFAGGPGRGVRRLALVTALGERVDSFGVKRMRGHVVSVTPQAHAVRLNVEGSDAGADCLTARWVLGADGLHSTTRAAIGAVTAPVARPRYGLRRHVTMAPWTDVVEVHWSACAEAYITPVAPDEVGVAILTSTRGRDHADWLRDFPALERRLAGAAMSTRALGAGPLQQNVSRRAAGRILLIGDAAGYVDALTGEGIALGIATARAAVDCIVTGRPDRYEASWRQISRRYRLLTRAVLFAAEHEPLRRAVIPVAVAAPPVFRAAVRALA